MRFKAHCSKEMEQFDLVNWNITQPISSARSYDKRVKIDGVLSSEVSFKHDCKIAILSEGGKPVTLENIGGKRTVRDVLEVIQAGLNKTLKVDAYSNVHWSEEYGNSFDKIKAVYGAISTFLHPSLRMGLVRKFEEGCLKQKDLLGDHVFFEGLSMRNGHVVMVLGS